MLELTRTFPEHLVFVNLKNTAYTNFSLKSYHKKMRLSHFDGFIIRIIKIYENQIPFSFCS